MRTAIGFGWFQIAANVSLLVGGWFVFTAVLVVSLHPCRPTASREQLEALKKDREMRDVYYQWTAQEVMVHHHGELMEKCSFGSPERKKHETLRDDFLRRARLLDREAKDKFGAHPKDLPCLYSR